LGDLLYDIERVISFQFSVVWTCGWLLDKNCELRSGFFSRPVETSYGHLPNLRVPKLRRGNKERSWTVLVRYQDAMQVLLDKALYLYGLGLSLRDWQEALFLFLGHGLSHTASNRVPLAAQSPMESWRQARLTEAEQRLDAFVAQWAPVEPEAVRNLGDTNQTVD
jgi:hypothetical protein